MVRHGDVGAGITILHIWLSEEVNNAVTAATYLLYLGTLIRLGAKNRLRAGYRDMRHAVPA